MVLRSPAASSDSSRRLPLLDAHLSDIMETDEMGVDIDTHLADTGAGVEQGNIFPILEADATGVDFNTDLADTGAGVEQDFTTSPSGSVFPPPPDKQATSDVRTAPNQTPFKGPAWKYIPYVDKAPVGKSKGRMRGRRGGVNNKQMPPPSTRTPKAVAHAATTPPAASPTRRAQGGPLRATKTVVLKPSPEANTTSLVAPNTPTTRVAAAPETPEIVHPAPNDNPPSDNLPAQGSKSIGVLPSMENLDVDLVPLQKTVRLPQASSTDLFQAAPTSTSIPYIVSAQGNPVPCNNAPGPTESTPAHNAPEAKMESTADHNSDSLVRAVSLGCSASIGLMRSDCDEYEDAEEQADEESNPAGLLEGKTTVTVATSPPQALPRFDGSEPRGDRVNSYSSQDETRDRYMSTDSADGDSEDDSGSTTSGDGWSTSSDVETAPDYESARCELCRGPALYADHTAAALRAVITPPASKTPTSGWPGPTECLGVGNRRSRPAA